MKSITKNALEHVLAENGVLLDFGSRLVGRSDEQHTMIDCVRHLLKSPLDVSAAAKETALELLPPEILLSVSTLKASIIFHNLRLVLRKSGINGNQRQGLFVPQAIEEALYAGDDALLRTAGENLRTFVCVGATLFLSPAAAPSSLGDAPCHSSRNHRPSEYMISSCNVDSDSKHFNESRTFSSILGKSPSPLEAQRTYLTY